jgi:hypothetical protein
MVAYYGWPGPYLRGMLPEGISLESSWTRTRCQSTNLHCDGSATKFLRFVHCGLVQTVGCSKGKIVSTFFINHVLQRFQDFVHFHMPLSTRIPRCR